MINQKLIDEVFIYLKEVEKVVKSSEKSDHNLLERGFKLSEKIQKIKPKNPPESNILHQLKTLCQAGAELSMYRIKR